MKCYKYDNFQKINVKMYSFNFSETREHEKKLRASFHHQLESLINRRLNDSNKMYVNKQIKINDSKIVPNETYEQMQERLMCLFREIIGHFMPYYGEKIEKQLREMFEEK